MDLEKKMLKNMLKRKLKKLVIIVRLLKPN